MQTLTDYQKLDTDLIMKGVYDWLFKQTNGLLQTMPVREVKGNGVKYNVETAYPGGAWTRPGDVIPEDTGTYTQRSAAIYELIGDADVDKFSIATNATQNPELIEIKRKTRGMMNEWYDQLIYGQTTTSSSTNQPKGLLLLCAEIESESTTDLDAPNNSQVVANHATSAALTIAKIEELVDACKSGATNLMMSRWSRRKLNALARASGNNLEHDKDQLGYFVTRFGEQTLLINDYIEDNFPDSSSSITTISTAVKHVTRANTTDNSPIFAMRLAEDGLCIIQAGGFKHENIGTVQNKDAIRHRFKWYTGFACYDKFSLSVLTGVNPET